MRGIISVCDLHPPNHQIISENVLIYDNFKEELFADNNRSIKEFVNSLLAATVLIAYREREGYDTVAKLLGANPQIQAILKAKNDQPLLPEKKEE